MGTAIGELMAAFSEIIGGKGEPLSKVCEKLPEGVVQVAAVYQGGVWLVSYIVGGE